MHDQCRARRTYYFAELPQRARPHRHGLAETCAAEFSYRLGVIAAAHEPREARKRGARALPAVRSTLGAPDRRTDLVPLVPSRRGHAPIVGVSMLPYRLVRAFAVDGSDDVVELVKALELPLAPPRTSGSGCRMVQL